MADEDESSKAGKASGKASPRSRKAPETKSTAQTKRAAPTGRRPRQAAATAQAAKGAPSPDKTEAEDAAQEASEREHLDSAKLVEALGEGGRRVMAKSRTYLREGVNAMAAAAAVTRLGRAAARAGAKDVLDGRRYSWPPKTSPPKVSPWRLSAPKTWIWAWPWPVSPGSWEP